MENGNAFTTQIAVSSTISFETINHHKTIGYSEDEKLGDFEFLFIIEILLLGPKNCYDSFLDWYIFLNRINSDWQKTKECRKMQLDV